MLDRKRFQDIESLAGGRYRIRIKGRLEQRWEHRISGFEISRTNDETILEGTPDDQSALVGLLNLMHDLGLRIVEVEMIEADNPTGNVT